MEPKVRQPIVTGFVAVLLIGILQDLLDVLLSSGVLKPIADFFFGHSGLSIIGAVIVFAVGAGISFWQPAIKQRTEPIGEWFNHPGRKPVKYTSTALLIIVVLSVLPWVLVRRPPIDSGKLKRCCWARCRMKIYCGKRVAFWRNACSKLRVEGHRLFTKNLLSRAFLYD